MCLISASLVEGDFLALVWTCFCSPSCSLDITSSKDRSGRLSTQAGTVSLPPQGPFQIAQPWAEKDYKWPVSSNKLTRPFVLPETLSRNVLGMFQQEIQKHTISLSLARWYQLALNPFSPIKHYSPLPVCRHKRPSKPRTPYFRPHHAVLPPFPWVLIRSGLRAVWLNASLVSCFCLSNPKPQQRGSTLWNGGTMSERRLRPWKTPWSRVAQPLCSPHTRK